MIEKNDLAQLDTIRIVLDEEGRRFNELYAFHEGLLRARDQIATALVGWRNADKTKGDVQIYKETTEVLIRDLLYNKLGLESYFGKDLAVRTQRKESGEATRMSNKLKEQMIETFRSSMGPSMMKTILDGRIPEQFLPVKLADKIRNGEVISEEEEDYMGKQRERLFRWSVDWMAKMFPKILGSIPKKESKDK